MGLFEGRQTRAEKLYSQKKYKEAEKLFDEVAHDREKTHGKDHEYTLTSKHWLAHSLYQQEKYQEAEKAYYQVMQGRRRTLGKDHKHTLTGKSWVAHSLYQQGKYQEAQRLFKEVAEACERTLGAGHVDTLAGNQWLWNTEWQLRNKLQKAVKPLAGTLPNENKDHDAEENLRHHIRGRDAFLGKGDEFTLGLKIELGELLLKQNRRQEADSLFQEVKDIRGRPVAKDREDKAARTAAADHLELQTKKQQEDQGAEESLRHHIRGRDAFLGKGDEFTLGLKIKLGESLLKQSRRQEAESLFQEVKDIRGKTMGKQPPIQPVSPAPLLGLAPLVHGTTTKPQEAQSAAGSLPLVHNTPAKLELQSPAGSLPLVHDTPAKSQEVHPPARSLPLVHDTPTESEEVQSSLGSLPLMDDTPAKSQEVQLPEGSLPLAHDTKAMSRDRLNTFFPARTESRQPYSDSDISQISTLLRQTNLAWSRIPRTYIILRTIDCLHHLDELIDHKFCDYLLPVNERGVPDCLSPKMRKMFLESQKLILTRSMDLEKGAEGHHCHFGRGDLIPFESKGVIGSGGFGQVDRVLSHISFREYARKQVSRKLAFSGRGIEALRGMIGEIEAMKKLKHHHIVEFVGSYTDPKFLSVIMKPVAEQDLYRYLRKAGSAKHAEMRTFFGCLATGLQFLHNRQIRHKDIKPGNILVHEGRVLFTDFGLSLDFEDATGSTTVGMVNFTTPRYSAPEVVLWEPRNTSSDIWSLGVIFLEMMVVLKGKTIQWMDEFLRAHGSQQTFVCSNLTGLENLLAELKQTANLSDNVALVWIQQILQEQHRSRPTATRLVRSINQPYSHGGPDTVFCGICCLAPDDTHSDSSDDLEEDFLRDFASQTRVR
ncbi:unnamed protein product [Penicillium bialowiezense]